MIQFRSLASSSKGNCYIVTDGATGEKLIIEAGIPVKQIKAAFDFDLGRAVGALISHEHLDHSHAAGDLIKCNIPVYSSRGTTEALDISAHVLEAGKQTRIGGFTVLPFRTMHDAAEPLGFLVRASDGDKLLFATDTVSIPVRAKCGIYAVEANFERALMHKNRLPEKLKRRIMRTHMDVQLLCGWLSACDMSLCREIHLIHMSLMSSDEARFVNLVRGCVPRTVKVYACKE